MFFFMTVSKHVFIKIRGRELHNTAARETSKCRLQTTKLVVSDLEKTKATRKRKRKRKGNSNDGKNPQPQNPTCFYVRMRRRYINAKVVYIGGIAVVSKHPPR